MLNNSAFSSPPDALISTMVPEGKLDGHRHRVAVIGGGMTGMATCYYLRKALRKKGIEADVTLFERNERLGGNVMKVRPFPESNLYMQTGPEFVDDGHKNIIHLCEKLDVELIKSGKRLGNNDYFFVKGTVHTPREFLKEYRKFGDAVLKDKGDLRVDGELTDRARELDKLSIKQYLESLPGGMESWIIPVIQSMYAAEIGADAPNLSALCFIDYVDAEHPKEIDSFLSDEKWRITGGTHRLRNALANSIFPQGKKEDDGPDVKLGEGIVAMEKTAHGITLTTASGTSQEFDHVISALPLPFLKKVKGIEAFASPEQMDVINNTQYARLTKIGCLTKGKPWKNVPGMDDPTGIIHTDRIFQNAFVSSEGQGVKSKDGVVTFYFCRGKETEGMNDEQLAELCKKDYAEMLGKSLEDVFQPVPAITLNWADHDSVCYVAPAPGQYTKLAEFGQPQDPRLDWVGSFIPDFKEGTAKVQMGFMNGSLAASEKLVKNFVKKLKGEEQEIKATSHVAQVSARAASGEMAAAV